ncbi:MAG TPA: hypothetical protein DCY13_15860 [Verrucomicrobiales bacterium]|nr:hypothetical protein [Verrucomicrobiales bacterium]
MFVMIYYKISFIRFQTEHPGQALTPINDWLVRHGIIGWSIPVVMVTLALLASRRQVHGAWREAVVQLGWLMALVWALLAIMAWQIQYVPILGPLGSPNVE